MNKSKLFKVIDELKNDIEKNLNTQSERTQIYIRSWVLGGLEMIESKAQGGRNYYPTNATYKTLCIDFLKAFICLNINEEIETETKKYLYENTKFQTIQHLTSILYYNK